MHILRRKIFQIHLINLRGDFHIVGHLRRRNNIIQCHVGRIFEYIGITAAACQFMPRSLSATGGIHFSDSLYHLKQSRSSRNTVSFQCRRHCQTDCLLCSAGISHHQACCHWILATLNALHRCIKRFQINGDICFFLHDCCLLSPDDLLKFTDFYTSILF